MEENKKQFNWKTFIIILMAALLAFSLYKVATLSDEIDHLKSRNSNLTGDIQILREEINSIYDNVDKQLKKQASLISGVDFSIGNPSEDMKTVELSLTIVPKLISDDMQVSVTVDGITAPLERKGNEFSGTIDVGLFVDYNQWPLLSIKTVDGTKTEYLEDVDVSYMFSRHLPSLYADMSGGSGKFSDGTLSVDLGFTVETKPASQNAPITFTSFTLIEEVNGKEISRQDITEEVLSSETIALLGVNDPSFQTDYLFGDSETVMQSKLQEISDAENEFTILLSHRPELFEVYADNNMDLVLSGHAHGGQFRLPFVGGLVAPNQGLFPKYDAGLYTDENTNMIVSRGIGNSILPFRVNNRPEVILVELNRDI